jgi:hypothetical protein
MGDFLAVRNGTINSMQGLADWLSRVTPEEFGQAVLLVRAMEKALEQAEDVLIERAIDVVRATGKRETDKGTMSVVLGAHTLRAIPTRTGTDPKKLEAHLRTKGVNPDVCMDATITYKVNDDKLKQAVASGKLTPDEVDACKYDTNYRLEVK